MRMLVGLGFAVDRIIQLPYMAEFYTDHGSYTRISSVLLSPYPMAFDLFDVFGSTQAIFALYCFAVFAGLAVAVGYRTRLSTACCWVLGYSLYNRCPNINPASDAEILLCLLFGFFMPWGELWSFDHPAPPTTVRVRPYQSAATVAWRLQVAFLYLTAACSKTSFHWGNGTATVVSLVSDQWAGPLGRYFGAILLKHHELGVQMTHLVVCMEFTLPLLLLTPVAVLQFIALVGMVGMHIAFGACLHLEAFTPLAVACLTGFLPRAFWVRAIGITHWVDSLYSRFCSEGRLANTEETMLSRPGPLASAWVSWAILGVMWSCATSTGSAPVPLSINGGEPWHAFGLKESWGMFVPVPFQGGWCVFRGLTRRGDWVNLEMDGSVDRLDMPRQLDETVPGSRQVLLYNALLSPSENTKDLQAEVAQNFRRRWESGHPDKLDALQKIEIYKFYREYDSEGDRYTHPDQIYVYTWTSTPDPETTAPSEPPAGTPVPTSASST